ncbi:MAG: C45 family autoproteolytic acyltransferase/hydrolase [Bacteroidales bacterium]|nr:C45 family autoproteolytic acyltransferase/hydrolase [Bacteroidales bacterium]
MKRLITILSSVLALTSCHQDKSDREGHIYDEDGVTVIDLHGSWHQMGRQYGLLAKERMADVLNYIDGKIGDRAGKKAEAADIADKLYSNYPEHLKDFFAGVSATSGLSLERVKLCNAVEYIEGTFFCSALSVWDGYASDKLIFGRNYDAASYAEIDRDIVVTVYHPKDGIPAATVGYAGEIYCVNGLNAKGIFIELNNGMPSAGWDIHWEMCPGTTQLFELLFSAAGMDDVDRFFAENNSFASFIIGVADKNEARSYEWCFDGARRGDMATPDGMMAAANHYVNGGWPFVCPTNEDSWNSITRRCNLVNLAETYKGGIDVERMKEIISTPIAEGGPKHDLLRYQIVTVPEDLVMHIKLPCNGRWSAIDMKKYLKQK